MNDQTTPARSALREAISARAAARATHQAAIDTLARADTVILDLAGEMERHTTASTAAEAQGADEIAAAIKRGGKPTVTLSRTAQEARHAQADIAARTEMAQSARTRLAAELEASARAAESADLAAVRCAAVVVGEEAVAFIDEMRAAMGRFFSAFDAIVSVEHIGVTLPRAVRLPPFPAKLQQAMFDTAAYAPAVELLRGPQIVSRGPQATAAAKWRALLAALCADPGATLADVADPTLPRDELMPVPQPGPVVREQPWVSNNGLSDALAAPHAVIA